jgi:c-di-GMP-binding flagellar brake protein YcgR
LEEACARNIPVEFHYEESSGGKIIVGRSRILSLDEAALLADTPTYPDGDGSIPVDRWFTVHFTMNHARYAFRTAITALGVRVKLNDQQRVSGVALRRPTAVKPVQRRAHYRISLAGGDPIVAGVARAHPEIPDACPIDGRLGEGRIADLSARGLALLVDRRVSATMKRGDVFFLTFNLPGVDDRFRMKGTVRHSSGVQPNHSVKVGFAFVAWEGQSFNRCQMEIARFIAELERRMLRRKRR